MVNLLIFKIYCICNVELIMEKNKISKNILNSSIYKFSNHNFNYHKPMKNVSLEEAAFGYNKENKPAS